MCSVGHYFDDGAQESVQALWEFIRTYMAGGPAVLAAAGVPPLIDLSVRPTWRNAWRWEMLRLGERFARCFTFRGTHVQDHVCGKRTEEH
jgi:hypothetical protein